MILLSRCLRILLFHRFKHSQFSCKLQRCKMQEMSLLDKPSKIRSVRWARFENPYLWVNLCLKLKYLCHGENSEDIQFIKVNEICARSNSAEIETEIEVKDEKIDSISEEKSEIEVDGEYSEVDVNYTVCESVHSDNSDCQQSVCEEDNFKGLTKDLFKNSEVTEAFKKLLKKAEKKVQTNKIDFLIKKRSYLKKSFTFK